MAIAAFASDLVARRATSSILGERKKDAKIAAKMLKT